MLEFHHQWLVHPLNQWVDSSLRFVIGKEDACAAVDPQHCFANPDGSLYAPNSFTLVRPAAHFTMEFYVENRAVSGDCHSPFHKSFTENGGRWPAHGICGTISATLVGAFADLLYGVYVAKGREDDVESYGAVADERGVSNGLVEFYRSRGIKRVFVYGWVFEFCVSTTALQLALAGFEVYVVINITAMLGITQGENSIQAKAQVLANAGVEFIYSSQVSG